MNGQLLAVLAVGMIGLGIFGLVGLWVYSHLERKPRQIKRHDDDLIVSHRFKQRKRRTMRPALTASMPAPDQPADDSLWQRPGGPLQPQRKAPIFGEGKPRHVRIDNTPRVIIPHETYGPTPQTGHASYQRNLPAVRIKAVDAPEQQPPTAPKADKPNKLNKSNNTMPLKRIK